MIEHTPIDTDEQRAASEQPLPENLPSIPLETDRDRIIHDNAFRHGIAAATRMLAAAHQHKFTYVLNQGHTLAAGCECGLCFGGLIAGVHPRGLILHRIRLEGMEDE